MRSLRSRFRGFALDPVFTLASLGAMLVLGACVVSPTETPPPAPTFRPLPTSPWGGRFRYRAELALKAETPGSVAMTVAVVRPQYMRVEGSALAKRRYRKVAKGFATSMGVDQERILMAKGLKVKGPYPSFDEMTYSDKNTADLALAPTLFLEIDYQLVGLPLQGGGRSDPKNAVYVGEYEAGRHWMMRAYKMVVSGWISFVLHEPLSGVKLWIKKLDLDEVRLRGVIAYAANSAAPPPPPATGAENQATPPPPISWTQGDVLYDGRPDSVASALKTYYGLALQKLSQYLDPQELVSLQPKIQEIRAKVRVGESR